MTRGKFIVFEGLDGAGTTTQAKRLAEWLRGQGRVVLETAQPSKGPIGKTIRAALGRSLLGRDGQRLVPETIAGLFVADRADHLATEIEPALAAGTDVICDRYLYSSLAYQGAECDAPWVAAMNARFPGPDIVLYLRVSAEVAGRRRAGRDDDPELYEVDAFQRIVAEGYDAVAQWRPDDLIVTIDGEADLDTIHRACRTALRVLPDFLEESER